MTTAHDDTLQVAVDLGLALAASGAYSWLEEHGLALDAVRQELAMELRVVFRERMAQAMRDARKAPDPDEAYRTAMRLAGVEAARRVARAL